MTLKIPSIVCLSHFNVVFMYYTLKYINISFFLEGGKIMVFLFTLVLLTNLKVGDIVDVSVGADGK